MRTRMRAYFSWMTRDIIECYVIGMKYPMTCGYLMQWCAEHQLPTEAEYNIIINAFNFGELDEEEWTWEPM